MPPPPPTSTLFPYTTLFRSSDLIEHATKHEVQCRKAKYTHPDIEDDNKEKACCSLDGKSSANPPVEIEQNNGNDQRLKQVLEAKFYKSNGDHKLRISSGSLSRHPFLQRSGLFQCLKDFNGVSCLPYIMYTDNVRPV